MMRKEFANWAEARFQHAETQNLVNINRALELAAPRARLVDLGCDDGLRTLEFATTARASHVHGVELMPAAVEEARARGITVTIANLNEPLPFDAGSFDVVVSNQVIEHLSDTDVFVSEIRRVLGDQGVAVISTENLSSWHNIAALILGWQPFSLTNTSMCGLGLGNPLAIHRCKVADRASWQHIKLFSYRGLKELFEAHGFRVRSIMGAGYYPFPAKFGAVEPRHAAFLTIVSSVH